MPIAQLGRIVWSQLLALAYLATSSETQTTNIHNPHHHISVAILMRLLPLRKPQSHALPRVLTPPHTAPATAPKFLTRRILSTTSRLLRKDNLQIPLLTTRPALQEIRGILGEVLEEFALRVRVVQFLHQQCKIVIRSDDGFEVWNVRFAALEVLQGTWKGVGEGDAEIIDGRLAAGVDVVLIDANGVVELEWWQGVKVW